MSRVRDIANILSGVSTDMATDAEVTSSIASHTAAADPHSVYLKESEYNAAGKNVVINGGFDFWQRGSSAYSGTPTANTPFYFGADRWFYATGTGSNSVRFERTAADTPGLQYGIKYGRNSGASGTAPTILGHVIESVNCRLLNGKTVTVSFYAKKMSNFTGENFFCQLVTGTGTDQGSQQIFIAWTGGAQAGVLTPTLTTTMQRFSFTATVPNGTNQMCVFFPFYTAQPSTAAADEFIQIEGVQVEVGSVATPFSRAGGSITGELAACQRYYAKSYNIDTAPGTSSALGVVMGLASNSSYIATALRFPVVMRTAPSMQLYSQIGTLNKVSASGALDSANTGGFDSNIIGSGGAGGVSVSGLNTSQFYYFHYVANAEL